MHFYELKRPKFQFKIHYLIDDKQIKIETKPLNKTKETYSLFIDDEFCRICYNE